MVHIVERSKRNLSAGWILRSLITERAQHPDMKRQRSRRQRALDLARARKAKGQYVPLCFVPTLSRQEMDEWRHAWRYRNGI